MNDTRRRSVPRLVRLLLPGGAPLARGVDRLEVALLAVLVLVGLLLVPVMLVFGSLTYSNVAEQADAQAGDRQRLVATLTEDAPSVTVSDGAVAGQVMVPARWRLPDGTPGSGEVPVDAGSSAGQRVDVWLDSAGEVASPPASPDDAIVAAALVVVVGWLTAAGVLTLVHAGGRRLLDRHRYREWDREWARVEPGWSSQSC